QTTTPSPFVQQAGQQAYSFAQNLAGQPFNPPLQNIVGFNPTQATAFSNVANLASAPNANNPFFSDIANDFSRYGAAPPSGIRAPRVRGANVHPATANPTQYIAPTLQLELIPTLQETPRQADIAKYGPGGVGAAATAAGAYGDARHGVENANVD